MNRHDSTRFSEEFANLQFNKDFPFPALYNRSLQYPGRLRPCATATTWTRTSSTRLITTKGNRRSGNLRVPFLPAGQRCGRSAMSPIASSISATNPAAAPWLRSRYHSTADRISSSAAGRISSPAAIEGGRDLLPRLSPGNRLHLPESSSSIRRAISRSHSASTDASTASSRLSSRAPASAALASLGNAIACFKTSEISCAILLF